MEKILGIEVFPGNNLMWLAGPFYLPRVHKAIADGLGLTEEAVEIKTNAARVSSPTIVVTVLNGQDVGEEVVLRVWNYARAKTNLLSGLSGTIKTVTDPAKQWTYFVVRVLDANGTANTPEMAFTMG